MWVLADACLRMERTDLSASAGRSNEQQPALVGHRRTSKQTRPTVSNTTSRVRTDRTLGGVLPDDRLLIQSITAFCCCTVCIVVIDAKKIDQSRSTYTLSRR